MRIKVTTVHYVNVEIDESKFTDEFMQEFRSDFYNFWTIGDHVKHIARLYANGGVSEFDKQHFIEGYGAQCEMGISVSTDTVDSYSEYASASGGDAP